MKKSPTILKIESTILEKIVLAGAIPVLFTCYFITLTIGYAAI